MDHVDQDTIPLWDVARTAKMDYVREIFPNPTIAAQNWETDLLRNTEEEAH